MLVRYLKYIDPYTRDPEDVIFLCAEEIEDFDRLEHMLRLNTTNPEHRTGQQDFIIEIKDEWYVLEDHVYSPGYRDENGVTLSCINVYVSEFI